METKYVIYETMKGTPAQYDDNRRFDTIDNVIVAANKIYEESMNFNHPDYYVHVGALLVDNGDIVEYVETECYYFRTKDMLVTEPNLAMQLLEGMTTKGRVPMKKVVVQVPFVIDEEFVDDVMCTALEGGINYWCFEARRLPNDNLTVDYASEVISRGGSLELCSDEDIYTFDLSKFIKGYEGYIKWCGEHKQEVYTDPCDIDAEIADLIIQYGLFGQIVWG